MGQKTCTQRSHVAEHGAQGAAGLGHMFVGCVFASCFGATVLILTVTQQRAMSMVSACATIFIMHVLHHFGSAIVSACAVRW